MPQTLVLHQHVNFLPSSELRFSWLPNFSCPLWGKINLAAAAIASDQPASTQGGIKPIAEMDFWRKGENKIAKIYQNSLLPSPRMYFVYCLGGAHLCLADSPPPLQLMLSPSSFPHPKSLHPLQLPHSTIFFLSMNIFFLRSTLRDCALFFFFLLHPSRLHVRRQPKRYSLS